MKDESGIKGVLPDTERKYTDSLCFVIFYCCVFISFSFNVYGLTNGNI